MKKCRVWLLTVFLFFFGLVPSLDSREVSSEEEIPTIRVEPHAFGKLLIRVPDFEGPPEISSRFTSSLRKLLNLHLFILASPLRPVEHLLPREYYLKGKINQQGEILEIKAVLEDLTERKEIKTYALTTKINQLSLAASSLADKLVEDLSKYQGIAQTKVAFVKRLKTGDHLYVSDFSKETVRHLRSASLILFPKFSPSGEKLVYLVYEEGRYFIEIYDLQKRSRKNLSLRGIGSPAIWNIDKRYLLISLEEQGKMGIYKLDIETKNLEFLIGGEGVFQVGDVSRDGKKILYVFAKRTGRPEVYMLDLETLTSKKISSTKGYHTSPRFSPKGNTVLYLSRRGESTYIHLLDFSTGKERKILFRGKLEDPTFSPTGDYILAFGEGPQGTGIYLIHLDSHLSTLYIPGKSFLFPSWTKL